MDKKVKKNESETDIRTISGLQGEFKVFHHEHICESGPKIWNVVVPIGFFLSRTRIVLSYRQQVNNRHRCYTALIFGRPAIQGMTA